MELTMDKLSRVLLPKKIRNELGLRPGVTFDVQRVQDGLHLRPLEDDQTLVWQGDVLVFAGGLQGDIQQALEQARRERERDILGWK